MAEKQLRQCSLFSANVQGKTLSEAITAFFAVAENANQSTFAIFYAPHKCFLVRFDEDKTITVSPGKEFAPVRLSEEELNKVFEARVFNEVSEMRWLNDPTGNHATAILAETQVDFDGNLLQSDPNVIGGLNQEYLLWGQSTGQTNGDWTQFATARIGAFYVPLPCVSEKDYARFRAVEYLKTFADSNVAVVDERLTGIESA